MCGGGGGDGGSVCVCMCMPAPVPTHVLVNCVKLDKKRQENTKNEFCLFL